MWAGRPGRWQVYPGWKKVGCQGNGREEKLGMVCPRRDMSLKCVGGSESVYVVIAGVSHWHGFCRMNVIVANFAIGSFWQDLTGSTLPY
jgi:hypothetical protein